MSSFKSLLGQFRVKNFILCLPFSISCSVVFFFFFTAIMNSPAFGLFLGILLTVSFFVTPDYAVIKRVYSENIGIASGILSCLFSYSFYRRAFESASIEGLARIVQRILPLSTDTVFLLFSAGGFAVGLFSILYSICFAWEYLDLPGEWKCLKRKIAAPTHGLRYYCALVMIYLVSFSALIRSNVNYHDDLQRKFDGEHGFHLFSRHLNSFLSRLLNTDNYLVDISPLTQILAVLLIAAASYIVIITFANHKRISLWSVVAVLPLGLSPYFQECMSFKFDSPFMALTIFLNLLPLLFYDRKPSLYIPITALCIASAATSYQACLGIFPSAVALLVLLHWIQGKDFKEILQLIFRSVGGYLTGVLVYRIFIMRPVDSYVTSETFSLSEMIPGVIRNLGTYFQYVVSDFDEKWLLCIGILVVSLLVLGVMQAKQKKALTGILGIAAVVLAACLSFGIYLALVEPSVHCRAMYGFGVFLAVLAVLVTSLPKSTIAKLSALYLSWCLIIFAFLYGNVVKDQQDYMDFRVETVLHDLHAMESFQAENDKKIQITGTMGMTPILENMPQYGKVLNRMVTLTFNQRSSFNYFAFMNFYDLENIEESHHLDEMDLPLVLDGYYHSIYSDGTNFLIELHEY